MIVPLTEGEPVLRNAEREISILLAREEITITHARWLTIHAHDGGFAAFMRGIRDSIEVEWDISKVPATGGLAASEAIASPDVGAERTDSRTRFRAARSTRSPPAGPSAHGY